MARILVYLGLTSLILALSGVIGYELKAQSVTGDNNPGLSVLSGTTPSIGGALLIIGTPVVSTLTINGAAPGMVCVMDPSSGNALIAGTFIDCYVSSANTVTVRLTGIVVLTPASQTYNVRVIP